MSESSKQRKRPVITFTVPGFPAQDPGRKMLWGVCWKSEAEAATKLRKCQRLLGDDAVFELEHMTAVQARKIAARGFNFYDAKAREKATRPKVGFKKYKHGRPTAKNPLPPKGNIKLRCKDGGGRAVGRPKRKVVS
jgi:hypothetical protein